MPRAWRIANEVRRERERASPALAHAVERLWTADTRACYQQNFFLSTKCWIQKGNTQFIAAVARSHPERVVTLNVKSLGHRSPTRSLERVVKRQSRYRECYVSSYVNLSTACVRATTLTDPIASVGPVRVIFNAHAMDDYTWCRLDDVRTIVVNEWLMLSLGWILRETHLDPPWTWNQAILLTSLALFF